MTKLKDILAEFALKSFPDWNHIQTQIFRELKKEKDIDYDQFVKVAENLRDYMNKNYFSGVWKVDKSKEELFDELLNVSRKTLS